MSPESARGLIFAVLMIHGLGHGGALGALIWIALRPGDPTGDRLAARSWLIPGLSASTAAAIAGGHWLVSMSGFVGAALAAWGLLPLDAWRPVAIVSAIVSLAGMILFLGTWPVFNTVAALAVNAAVLSAPIWSRWAPQLLPAR